jgi:hypothetical protein
MCVVANNSQHKLCVITFNMADVLCMDYTNLYVVDLGEKVIRPPLDLPPPHVNLPCGPPCATYPS